MEMDLKLTPRDVCVLDDEVPEAEEVSFGMGVDLDAEEEEQSGLVESDDDVDTETLGETESAEVRGNLSAILLL